jgi:hypothetical protein
MTQEATTTPLRKQHGKRKRAPAPQVSARAYRKVLRQAVSSELVSALQIPSLPICPL